MQSMCEVAWDIITGARRCEIMPQFCIYSLWLLLARLSEIS